MKLGELEWRGEVELETSDEKTLENSLEQKPEKEMSLSQPAVKKKLRRPGTGGGVETELKGGGVKEREVMEGVTRLENQKSTVVRLGQKKLNAAEKQWKEHKLVMKQKHNSQDNLEDACTFRIWDFKKKKEESTLPLGATWFPTEDAYE